MFKTAATQVKVINTLTQTEITDVVFATDFDELENFIAKNKNVKTISDDSVYNKYYKVFGVKQFSDDTYTVIGVQTYKYTYKFSQPVKIQTRYTLMKDTNKTNFTFEVFEFGSNRYVKLVKAQNPFDKTEGFNLFANTLGKCRDLARQKDANGNIESYEEANKRIKSDVKRFRALRHKLFAKGENATPITEEEKQEMNTIAANTNAMILFEAWLYTSF